MEFQQLQLNIKEELSKLENNYSLYVKFLDSNEEISVNYDFQHRAASLIKIPLVVTLLEKSVDLDEKVTVNPKNIVKGSGVIHLLNHNNEYTVKDLVVLALSVSDNTAANELLDMVTPKDVEEKMVELSLSQTTCRHKMMIKTGEEPNYTSAKDMGILLEKLYKNELPFSSEILEWMNEEKLRHGIPKNIPNEIKIPHKMGSLPDAMHDVGILFSDKPFLLAFLSENQTNKMITSNVIAECAKMCFDYSNQ